MIGSVTEAAIVLKRGGIIAYPTESCFGLGCDPTNKEAIRRILLLKRRSRLKGLILVSDHVCRFRPFIRSIPTDFRKEVSASWPGPSTWLIPVRNSVSIWLRGNHCTLAVRVSRHPVVRGLCRTANMAIVSTSANLSGRPALKSYNQVCAALGKEVDLIVSGDIGREKTASVIRDARSGEVIRE